jgi:hypothetical protein
MKLSDNKPKEAAVVPMVRCQVKIGSLNAYSKYFGGLTLSIFVDLLISLDAIIYSLGNLMTLQPEGK